MNSPCRVRSSLTVWTTGSRRHGETTLDSFLIRASLMTAPDQALFDGDVHRQGQKNGVVEERHYTVRQGHPPHWGGENLHVRHLRRHPDHERVVEEIPRARLFCAGKAEPPGIGALVGRMRPIEDMGVMEGHDGVQRGPPEWHTDDREHETTGVRLPRLVQQREDRA